MSQLTDANTAAARVVAPEIRMSHVGRRVTGSLTTGCRR